MPDEEKKKRTKKFVVEETSTSEPVIEAEIPEEDSIGQIGSETAEEVEDKEAASVESDSPPSSQEKEPEHQKEKVETQIKKEPREESILIPKNEKLGKVSFEMQQEKDAKVSGFWVFALALFIIASLIGGGTLIFKAGVEKGKLESQSTLPDSASPSPTASASSSAEVKREDLNLQVLNGTGKTGVAGSAKDYLEGLGYKDVAAGNASASDFTQTEISIKDAKKAYLETLKTDLAKKYEVAETAKTLSSTSDFDAVITIGSK